MQPLTWLSNTQRYPCQQIILEEVTMLLRVIRIPTSTSTKPISSCRKVQEVEEETMLLRAIKTPTSASTKPISTCRKVQVPVRLLSGPHLATTIGVARCKEEEQETMLLRAIKTPTSASTKQISNCRIAQENQGEARKQVLETIFGVQDLPGVLWTIY